VDNTVTSTKFRRGLFGGGAAILVAAATIISTTTHYNNNIHVEQSIFTNQNNNKNPSTTITTTYLDSFNGDAFDCHRITDYNPNNDYLFFSQPIPAPHYETFDHYCWTDVPNQSPRGKWKLVSSPPTNGSFRFCGRYVVETSRCTILDNTYYPGMDYCFQDEVQVDHYCWYYTNDKFPVGDWKGVNAPVGGGCGEMCTDFKQR